VIDWPVPFLEKRYGIRKRKRETDMEMENGRRETEVANIVDIIIQRDLTNDYFQEQYKKTENK